MHESLEEESLVFKWKIPLGSKRKGTSVHKSCDKTEFTHGDDAWVEKMEPIAHELLADFGHDSPSTFTALHGVPHVICGHTPHSFTTTLAAEEEYPGQPMQRNAATLKPSGLQASRTCPVPASGINEEARRIGVADSSPTNLALNHPAAAIPATMLTIDVRTPLRPSVLKAQLHNR